MAVRVHVFACACRCARAGATAKLAMADRNIFLICFILAYNYYNSRYFFLSLVSMGEPMDVEPRVAPISEILGM